MPRVRLSALSLLLVGLAWSPAFAQASTHANVFGTVGLHLLWDDESYLGAGFLLGGGAAVPVGRGWTVRGRVLVTHNTRDFNNGVVFEHDGTRYTAEVVKLIPAGSGAFYAGGGLGGYSSTRASTFGPNPQDPRGPTGPTERFSSSATDAIYGGIVGGVLSAGRFRLQPEASLWLSSGYHVVIETGLSIGWSW